MFYIKTMLGWVSHGIIPRDFYGTLTNLSVPVLLFHKI